MCGNYQLKNEFISFFQSRNTVLYIFYSYKQTASRFSWISGKNESYKFCGSGYKSGNQWLSWVTITYLDSYGSISYQFLRDNAYYNIEVCTTNNCNSQIINDPSALAPVSNNNFQCYVCGSPQLFLASGSCNSNTPSAHCSSFNQNYNQCIVSIYLTND